MNNACSTACAMPGMSSSSEKLPTLTLRLALALSVSGSCTSSASSLLGSLITRYDLSSRAGFSRSSVTRWTCVMTLAKPRVGLFTMAAARRGALKVKVLRQEGTTAFGQELQQMSGNLDKPRNNCCIDVLRGRTAPLVINRTLDRLIAPRLGPGQVPGPRYQH